MENEKRRKESLVKGTSKKKLEESRQTESTQDQQTNNNSRQMATLSSSTSVSDDDERMFNVRQKEKIESRFSSLSRLRKHLHFLDRHRQVNNRLCTSIHPWGLPTSITNRMLHYYQTSLVYKNSIFNEHLCPSHMPAYLSHRTSPMRMTPWHQRSISVHMFHSLDPV